MNNKKTILSFAILSTCFAFSNTAYNAFISKDYTKFEEGLVYNPTGEITCSTLNPLVSEIYKDTSFIQDQTNCTEKYVAVGGYEKQVPVEDRTEQLVGSLVLDNCKVILAQGHSRGNDIYTINQGGSDFDTQCEMNIDGGGWTLVASKADDGNNYWTWNNRAVLHNGGVTGDANNISNDFQSPAWSLVPGDDVMLSDTTLSKYLIYSTIINNEPLKNEYTSSNVTSLDYTPRIKSGTWWVQSQCDNGTMYVRTLSPDSDTHGWAEGSKGFVFRSTTNNGCNYDDTFGGLMSAMTGHTATERGWENPYFYHQNFDNDAMTIWVK